MEGEKCHFTGHVYIASLPCSFVGVERFWLGNREAAAQDTGEQSRTQVSQKSYLAVAVTSEEVTKIDSKAAYKTCYSFGPDL